MFTASGGGYAGVKSALTYTSGHYGTTDLENGPRNLKATGGVGTLSLTWDAPLTRETVTRYLVQTMLVTTPTGTVTATMANNKMSPYTQNVSASRTNWTYRELPAGSYGYRVIAVFDKGTAAVDDDSFTEENGDGTIVSAVEG